MIYNLEIEYIDNNEEYNYIYVDIYCNPFLVDDSFNYAGTHCTNGRSGTHNIPKYPIVEELEWHELNYNREEILIIKNYIEKNHKSLRENICKEWEDINN